MCEDCLEDAECQCGSGEREEDEDGFQTDGFCQFEKDHICKECGHRDVAYTDTGGKKESEIGEKNGKV